MSTTYKFNFNFDLQWGKTNYKAENDGIQQQIIVHTLWGDSKKNEQNVLKIIYIFLKDNETYYTYSSIGQRDSHEMSEHKFGLKRVEKTTKPANSPKSFSIHFNIVDRRLSTLSSYTQKWITGEVKCKIGDDPEFTHYKFDDQISVASLWDKDTNKLDNSEEFKKQLLLLGGNKKTKRRRRNKKRHNKTVKRRRRV
jgi:hypothetical protein